MVDRMIADEAATIEVDQDATDILKTRFPHLWSDEELLQRETRAKEVLFLALSTKDSNINISLSEP